MCWEKTVEAGSVQGGQPLLGTVGWAAGLGPVLSSPGSTEPRGPEVWVWLGGRRPLWPYPAAFCSVLCGAQTLLSCHPSEVSVPLRYHQASLGTGRRPTAVPGGEQLFAGSSSESFRCVLYLRTSEHVTYKILFRAFSRLTLEHELVPVMLACSCIIKRSW